MTKRIHEFKLDNITYFEFDNLNNCEDLFLLSYIFEHEMGAEINESFIGLDYFFRTFKKDNLEFKLFDDRYLGLCLTSLKQNKENNDILRRFANSLLDIIKVKSKYYKSENERQKILSSWQEELAKWKQD